MSATFRSEIPSFHTLKTADQPEAGLLLLWLKAIAVKAKMRMKKTKITVS
jgi:hypothetical protein